jgi:hypothetical protein
MTAPQIAVEIIIALASIVVGAFLRTPLERFQKFLNRPGPFTPQTRAQWTQYLAVAEESLQRINYFDAHPRDLYIYLFQLVLGCVLFDGLAFVIFIWAYAHPNGPQNGLFLSLTLVLLVLGIALGMIGIFEGGPPLARRVRSAGKQFLIFLEVKPSQLSEDSHTRHAL